SETIGFRPARSVLRHKLSRFVVSSSGLFQLLLTGSSVQRATLLYAPAKIASLAECARPFLLLGRVGPTRVPHTTLCPHGLWQFRGDAVPPRSVLQDKFEAFRSYGWHKTGRSKTRSWIRGALARCLWPRGNPGFPSSFEQAPNNHLGCL